eukprot:XP_011678749.1 PREDICTED: uncharacterized protein LOC105445219 [Strongylocentrotus purpuratus]
MSEAKEENADIKAGSGAETVSRSIDEPNFDGECLDELRHTMAKSKHQGRGNSSRNRNRSGKSSRNRNRSGNKGKYKLYVSGPGFHTQLTLNPPNQSSVKFTDQQGRQTEILVDVKNVRSLKGTTSSSGDGKNSSRKDTGPLSRSSNISDKMLSKLAGKIGEGWSQFGIQHLGMSKVDIDHFKHNRSTVSN